MLITGLLVPILTSPSAAADDHSHFPPVRASLVSPVTGGNGQPVIAGTSFNLNDLGYQQSEYFLTGVATAYQSSTPLTADGKWSVAPQSTAPYTTRAVVYRPSDPRRFNGTVVVEWLNVSGGVDAAPDWVLSHNELIRQGYAYVGVSAQAVGANQLKTADPVRYASINFPGDSYSYDIYSQAGQAVSQDYRTVLAGLRPRTVLGVGESQSAARLVTYLDAVQPIANVYDGLLVHSRSAAGSALSQAPQAAIAAPAVTTIRNDLRVPVLVFETETDIFNSNLGERQPDTARFRLWEVAGTSHYDEYGLSIGPGDTGNGDGAVQALAAMQHPTNVPTPGIACDLPVNTGPAHWVLNDAVYALNAWVRRHVLPPTAPRITVVNTSPVVFATDANGNSIGGIRTPQVDAPVAILSGLPNTGAGAAGAFCRLFGSTVPYGTVQLATLYPSHASFVADWAHAAARDVRQGFLLPADAAELVDAAAASGIGG